MSMASRNILSNFFEEKCPQSHPQYLSKLSRAIFATTFLKIAVCNVHLYQKASKFLASVSTGTILLLKLLAYGAHVHAHIAISRKVVRKSARDNHERYCGWFWVHCYSKKFKRMAWQAMDICLWVLKESNKSSFDSYSVRNSVLIIWIVTCTFFPTTFLKIAVYKMATCADTRQY